MTAEEQWPGRGGAAEAANVLDPAAAPVEPVPLHEVGAVTVGPPWLALPADRRQLRLRAVRDGLVIAGLLTSAFVLVVIPSIGRSLGYDAFAYWSIDLSAVYERALQGQYALGGLRYAPPMALLFAPLGSLPWWLFLWLWEALLLATLVYLGGRWWVVLLALPPVALELEHGNVHLLMAAAIVLGFRYPWTWAFVLLTKVTPGVGLLWFAVRREWRALAIALGVTAAICAIGYVTMPGLWSEWINALTVANAQGQDLSIPPPLVFRLPVAVVLVAWGARTDRPWTVGVAAMLSLPIIWPHGLAVALAAVPFLRSRADARRRADPVGSRAGFIPLRQLFGPARGEDPASVVHPLRFVAAVGAIVGAAALVALVAGPRLSEIVGWASAYIVPPGP